MRAVDLELAAEACAKADIQALVEKLLLDVRGRQDRREPDEDAVMDVLDGLGEVVPRRRPSVAGSAGQVAGRNTIIPFGGSHDGCSHLPAYREDRRQSRPS